MPAAGRAAAGPGARACSRRCWCIDGRPLELDAHLARLDASAARAVRRPVPARRARGSCSTTRAAPALARLRLTVAPDGDGGLAADVVVAPVDARRWCCPAGIEAWSSRRVVVAGGIGAHKWADRRLLGRRGGRARAAAAAARSTATARSSKPAAATCSSSTTGSLVTPPADGRILPGVTRGRVLRIADGARHPGARGAGRVRAARRTPTRCSSPARSAGSSRCAAATATVVGPARRSLRRSAASSAGAGPATRPTPPTTEEAAHAQPD